MSVASYNTDVVHQPLTRLFSCRHLREESPSAGINPSHPIYLEHHQPTICSVDHHHKSERVLLIMIIDYPNITKERLISLSMSTQHTLLNNETAFPL